MKRHIPEKLPSALACGLLEDSGRALFLVRKGADGLERIELPCVLLSDGENPVARLSEEFRRQTGIDGQVHEVLFQKRHNAGTRKRKAWVPALAFKITARNACAKVAGEFSGYRWISSADLGKHRLSKMCEWLRQG